VTSEFTTLGFYFQDTTPLTQSKYPPKISIYPSQVVNSEVTLPALAQTYTYSTAFKTLVIPVYCVEFSH
jgi:hypothetical protein